MTNVAEDTENKVSEVEASEATENVADSVVEEPKGLSRRDALEVAIAAEKPEPKPDKVEVKAHVRTKTQKEEKAQEIKTFEPPAEYTKEEKEDFRALTPKQQEAAIRLHSASQRHRRELQAEREAINKEKEEIAWGKELVTQITPYLKSVGEKIPTHQALINALKLRKEWEEGDPREVAAAYLQAKGHKVPADLLSNDDSTSSKKLLEEMLNPLHQEIKSLKEEKTKKEFQERVQMFGQSWNKFESETNAAGTPRYPDLQNAEAGLKLASSIGTLCNGQSATSQEFIRSVQARIPDLTYEKLFAEAYKFYGGRIDDSASAPRPISQKQHIAKSNRAASSVPGSGGSLAGAGSVTKFKTRREALASSLREIREREGH